MNGGSLGPVGRAGERMRLVGYTPPFYRAGLRTFRAVWQDPADGREYVYDYEGRFGCEEWRGWVIDTHDGEWGWDDGQ